MTPLTSHDLPKKTDRLVQQAVLYVALCLAAGCRPSATQELSVPAPAASAGSASRTDFAGSKTCRDCHEDFYKLWSTSHHGLAMQPYTAELARRHLTPQHEDVVVGNRRYRALIEQGQGVVREMGPDGEKLYPIEHVMGGKNVYYFLTPRERGRLQVLPVAYDVRQKSWFDTAGSGVRHFPDRRDEALPWTDRMFAFNTTCFNCHVSQLATNYDLATDTYRTTWAEPGISCESCHGPAAEHVRVMEAGEKGRTSREIKIIRTKEFTPQQMNDLCATCHAKLAPLSLSFLPGESFFDHYDLVTLEHADFYPDGRDLGENYTYTSWLMSPCVRSGKLDCNHCHTPSGRMRFEGDQSNQSCMPCHEKHVANPAAHGHHKEPKNNACVACHMPMTRFAAMNRSDHSMRPPTPATTLAFGSPNACNLCHTDKDAAWADAWVRTWYPRDYQAEVVRRAELIDAARKRRWSRLPEMLADLDKPDVDAVYKASLVRLLHDCDQESPWPVIARMLKDPSPLVRASAASTLGARLTPDVVRALLGATADASRLVRIRAAASLAAVAPEAVPSDRDRRSLAKAIEEFQAAMTARPDDWSSYANLGNFHMERRDFQKAVENYEISHRLEPRTVGPMVNAAIAYSNLGRNDRAEVCLRRALGHEPANAAANFNLGLLLGEAGRLDEAQQALRLALKSDPQMAAAAYNLGVLLSKKDLQEAVAWCRKAYRLRPDDPKYAHTLAFYLRQQGDVDAAVDVLRRAIQGAELHLDSALLLAEIHESRGDAKAAADVYRQALSKTPLPAALRREMEARIRAAESGRREPKE